MNQPAGRRHRAPLRRWWAAGPVLPRSLV